MLKEFGISGQISCSLSLSLTLDIGPSTLDPQQKDRLETCLSVCPPNGSLYAISTCRYLRLLPSPFGQGFLQRTQVENLGPLANPFGQALRVLALTCAHFGRDQICTQVNASFSPFGHPTQVDAS